MVELTVCRRSDGDAQVGGVSRTAVQAGHLYDLSTNYDRPFHLPAKHFVLHCLLICLTCTTNTHGAVTSHNLLSPHDRHFVGITRYNVWSCGTKIYPVIQIKLNQFRFKDH